MNPQYDQSGIFTPSTPTVDISTQPSAAYTPYYGSDTQLGQMMQKYGGTLSPQSQFTKELPYQQFADPFRESLNVWEKSFARPEFEERSLNPFRRQWGANAATGGLSQMLGGGKRYQSQADQLEGGYQDRLSQARDSLDQQIRGMYESKLRQYYDSPTAFRK